MVAIAVYSMPFGQAVDSALNGAAFGLFPMDRRQRDLDLQHDGKAATVALVANTASVAFGAIATPLSSQ